MIRMLIEFLKAWLVGRQAEQRRYVPVDDLVSVAAVVQRGVGCWPARQHGTCGSCGHEWIPGEVVGAVEQAYEVTGDGMVRRSPASRVVCGLCKEQQRVEGDLSLRWAREAGLL